MGLKRMKLCTNDTVTDKQTENMKNTFKKFSRCLLYLLHTGGGSSIIKVPWDVPPARVYFFKLSSLANGIFFANLSPFSLGKGMLFVNIGQV